MAHMFRDGIYHKSKAPGAYRGKKPPFKMPPVVYLRRVLRQAGLATQLALWRMSTR